MMRDAVPYDDVHREKKLTVSYSIALSYEHDIVVIVSLKDKVLPFIK